MNPEQEAAVAGPRRALVLSGGGARGAYEAGVLRFLFDELPADLGHAPGIDIVTGTSVGAIHACFVAATAHLDEGRGQRISRVWQGLEADALFGSATHELLRLPRRMLELLRSPEALEDGELPERLFGLLDTQRLEALVTQTVPWPEIHRNLVAGRIQALCVAATEVATGRAVAFVEQATSDLPPWTHDTSIVPRAAAIGPAHALASAAIPLLFPAVRVGDAYYTDGGLRLNTPLSPALRLGADRVLVIALRSGVAGAPAELQAQRIEHFGNPLFLVGKVLNALLLDRVETDLSHMRLLNDVLRRVRDAGGGDVLAAVNATVRTERGQPYKVVDDLVVRPTQDLGLLAGRVAQASRKGQSASGAIRFILGALGFGDAPFEADLLSYLLFDASYTQPLMQLGLEDARRLREPLLAFFRD